MTSKYIPLLLSISRRSFNNLPQIHQKCTQNHNSMIINNNFSSHSLSAPRGVSHFSTCDSRLYPVAAHTKVYSKKKSRVKQIPKFRKKDVQNVLFDELFEKYPDLEQYGIKTLTPYFDWMNIFLFRPDQAAEMLLNCPKLLEEYEEKLPVIESALRNLGFNGSEAVKVLYKNPSLILLPPKVLPKAYGFLTTYFSVNESTSVIQCCSEAILQTEDTLKDKLEYLIKIVCHTTPSIANSRVLLYPMKHIEIRHEFLLRTGILKIDIPYKKLYKGDQIDKEHKKRQGKFTPHNIVCTSDQQFLEICTSRTFTINQLAAFEEAFNAEKEEQLGNEILRDAYNKKKKKDTDTDDFDYDEMGDYDDTDSNSRPTQLVGFSNSDLYYFYY